MADAGLARRVADLPLVPPVIADLPLGYKCRFEWSHERGGMSVSFFPRTPLVKDDARLRFTLTHQRFWKAYRDCRRDFLQTVANLIGEPVTIADDKGREKIRPNRVH